METLAAFSTAFVGERAAFNQVLHYNPREDLTRLWHGRFLKTAVIPNAVVFGYLIEISEILAGVALIVCPLLCLFARGRISARLRVIVLVSIAVAAIGGAFLAINLHLFSAASHPWLIPESGLDKGIDLDSVLPAIQIVIAVVSILFLRRLRRDRVPHITPRGAQK